MAFSEFDKAMKELELYHGLRVPAGAFTILRIDGRSFSKVTVAMGLEKPFDLTFNEVMGKVTAKLVTNMGAIYGYHQSDEISLLLPRDTDLFDREVEKLVSVSAGLASSAFTREIAYAYAGLETLPHFDSRVIVACNEAQVCSYFQWRQQDATRNALNSWAHWTAILRDKMTARQAGHTFENQTVSFKNEFLFKRGINFNDLPSWQKLGTGLSFKSVMKTGFNPKTGEHVQVPRRELTADAELPRGDAYAHYVENLIYLDVERRR